MFALNGHLYAVVGSQFLEIFSDGTFQNNSFTYGVNILPDDGRKVWIAANPAQIMLVSGGNGYICTPTIQFITAPGFPQGNVSACEFLDGFFFATIKNSQQFQISALNDGTSWDAADISSKESRPDFIVAPYQLREEMWFFGSLSIQPFYNNGAALFPIVPNQSAVINAGLMAAESVVRMGNTLYWLELDETGHGIFCMNSGYDKLRISNHAIESVWNLYSNLDQTYSWAFQENGHWCVRVNFPNTDNNGGSASWEYDQSVNEWTEVPFWNQDLAREEAHRGYCSAVCFDKILVGDRANGKIYELNSTYLDDDGAIIRRERRSPHLYQQKHRINYGRLELDGNTGIGLGDASNPDTFNPKGLLSYSNDGGRTFSQLVREVYFGPQGSYLTRPFSAGLGSGRDRVFKFVVTAPVDWAISAAVLEYEVLDN